MCYRPPISRTHDKIYQTKQTVDIEHNGIQGAYEVEFTETIIDPHPAWGDSKQEIRVLFGEWFTDDGDVIETDEFTDELAEEIIKDMDMQGELQWAWDCVVELDEWA